jgi:hypothetical protein
MRDWVAGAAKGMRMKERKTAPTIGRTKEPFGRKPWAKPAIFVGQLSDSATKGNDTGDYIAYGSPFGS